jgi:hypothetical protein
MEEILILGLIGVQLSFTYSKPFSVKVNETVAPGKRSEFCTGEFVFSYCVTVKFGFKATFGFMGFYFYGGIL